MPLTPQTEVNLNVRHLSRLESINDAWRYLLREAPSIARGCGVEPHELILSRYRLLQLSSHRVLTSPPVTRSVTGQIYSVRHFGPTPFNFAGQQGRPGMPQHRGFGQQPNFPGHVNPHLHFGAQPPAPLILYLFTSLNSDHVPYWSQTPMCVPPGSPPPALQGPITHRTGWVR